MMTLLLLALLTTTPDGLPPKAAPAHDAPSSPIPAAGHGTNVEPPAAAVRVPDAAFEVRDSKGNVVIANGYDPGPAVGACGERNCICVEGCDGVKCVGGCNKAKQATADTWHALGGAYAGWLGFGTLDPATGNVLVRWSCRQGSTDVRPGLPALVTRPAPVAAPPSYYLPPQAFGACAGGQCPAPTYTYRRGFFGTR